MGTKQFRSALYLFAILALSNNLYASPCMSIVCKNSALYLEHNPRLQNLDSNQQKSASQFQLNLSSLHLEASVIYKTETTGQITKLTFDEQYQVSIAEQDDALNLLLSSYGWSNWHGLTATNLQDSLSLLQAAAPSMSKNEKLFLLSQFGTLLANGYDENVKNAASLEDVYFNTISGDQHGGICGDIHKYLSLVAKALGFETSGINTVYWKHYGVTNNNGNGHIVAYFRDPETGNYYLQNYDRLINSGQNTIPGAIDVMTRLLSPATNISFINTRGSVYHAYLPIISRWVFSSLDELIKQNNNNFVLSENSGFEQKFAAIFRKKIKQARLGVFANKDSFNIDGQNYELTLSGISLDSDLKWERKNKWLHDLLLQSRIQIGQEEIITPNINPDILKSKQEGSGQFVNMHIVGSASINKLTGQIELALRDIDIRHEVADVYIEPQLKWNINNLFSLLIDRRVQGTRGNYNSKNFIMRPAYDQVALIIDSRDQERRLFIRYKNSLYALEGVEANSAIALRQELAATINLRKFGQVSLILDAMKVLNNPQQDPIYDYYQQTITSKVSLEWKKQISRKITALASFYRKNGETYFPFDEDVNPMDLYQKKTKNRFAIELRTKF